MLISRAGNTIVITIENFWDWMDLFDNGVADEISFDLDAEILDAFFPDWSNITFRNITCIGSKQAVDIQGLKGKPVHNILFDQVTILGNKNGIKLEWAENMNVLIR